MKEYFLKVNNNGSLNGGYLSVWEDGKETILINSICKPTLKGWKSSSLIYEDLDIIFKESDNDFIITETCANYLLNKYSNVNVKLYCKNNYKITAAHAIAEFITKNGTDPYDIG